jgi:hypothetical protein
VPQVPVNIIEAADLSEAKKKILSLASQFGTVTNQGLYEFMGQGGIDFEEMAALNAFPEIDLDTFKMEFFSDLPEITAGGAEKDENEGPTEDQYRNASIKQIVLYYPVEEYGEVVALLGKNMQLLGLEDNSQVVKALLEKNSA